MYDIIELSNKSLDELYAIAETLNIPKVKSYSKEDLVYKILDEQAIQGVGRPMRKPRARIQQQRSRVEKVTEIKSVEVKSEEVEKQNAPENNKLVESPSDVEKKEVALQNENVAPKSEADVKKQQSKRGRPAKRQGESNIEKREVKESQDATVMHEEEPVQPMQTVQLAEPADSTEPVGSTETTDSTQQKSNHSNQAVQSQSSQRNKKKRGKKGTSDKAQEKSPVGDNVVVADPTTEMADGEQHQNQVSLELLILYRLRMYSLQMSLKGMSRRRSNIKAKRDLLFLNLSLRVLLKPAVFLKLCQTVMVSYVHLTIII